MKISILVLLLFLGLNVLGQDKVLLAKAQKFPYGMKVLADYAYSKGLKLRKSF